MESVNRLPNGAAVFFLLQPARLEANESNIMRHELTTPAGGRRKGSPSVTGAVLGLCLLALGRPLSAQEVLMPPVQIPNTPPAVQEYQQQNPMVVFTPAGFSRGSLQTPLEWGPFMLRPRAFYRFLDGTGIRRRSRTTTRPSFNPFHRVSS